MIRNDIVVALGIIILIAIVFGIGYMCGNTVAIKKQESFHIVDTTYNKVVLDSIEYNIIKRDSVIYEIQKKMKYEIEKSFLINDSSAVELFKKLASGD